MDDNAKISNLDVNFVSHDPVSNTGRGTPNNSYNTCIDYFKFRVSGSFSFEDDFVRELLKLLYLDADEYDSFPSKGGYKIYLQFDESTTIMGSNEKSKLKDGSDCWYVELKGQGCRNFENRMMMHEVDARFGWYKLFEYLFQVRINNARQIEINRIDATLDDFTGNITCEEIEDKYLEHDWVSRIRRKSIDKNIKFDDIKNRINKGDGWTLTHGGRTSRQLCMYNKYLERKARGYDVFKENWIRFESRFFDDNANWAFLQILNGLRDNTFNQVVCSLIGGIIEFKEENDFDLNHKYRALTWKKWEELLNNASSLSYVPQQKLEEDITMNNKKIWLISSPYKLMCMAFMSDPVNFSAFLSLMMRKAIKRMTRVDYKRVNYHRHEIGLDMLQPRDLDELVKDYFNLKDATFGDLPLYLQKYFVLGLDQDKENEYERKKEKLLQEEFDFSSLVKDIDIQMKRLGVK